MERLPLTTGKDSIADALKGYAAINEEVKLFDFGNVIVRKDYREVENVRILSGGGSGNEPAYAGFVGKGMLTAAIQGNIFQSPTSKEILRVLRELSLNHLAGILVIVQGTSSTALNFGLAVERAIKEKIRVKMMVVTDDCNNPKYLKTRRRALSGISLIIKMAGAMAEAGHTINEIYATCIEAEKHLFSISVGLKHLTQSPEICLCRKTIGTNEIEIGVGVCQEQGIKKMKLSHSSDIAQIVIRDSLRMFTEKYNKEKAYPVVILMNTIGGLLKVEEYVFIKQLILAFQTEDVPILRLFNGTFFSSHAVVGSVVSVMAVYDEKIIPLLDARTNATGWRVVNQTQITPRTLSNVIIPGRLVKRTEKYNPPMKGPKISKREVNIYTVGIQFICEALISCEKQINLIDSELADGDAGKRLKDACESILQKLNDKKLNLEYPYALFDALSKLVESSVGRTLGCIYCILFEAAANYFEQFNESDTVNGRMWLGALEAACETLKKYGVVEFGDETIYDTLEMCARTVKEHLNDGESLDAFRQGVEAAQELSHKRRPQCKYPDSGAYSVGVWLRALYEGLKLVTPDR